jgi:hypothetical protein
MQYLGFVNLTPFAAQPLLLSDERGADLFTCVVKGSFGLHRQREGTSLSIAGEQAPVSIAPEYYGDPELSSVKYDSDAVPVKLGTDIVLIGHARPEFGSAAWLDVSLTVGPAQCVVRVFGNRVWTAPRGKWTATPPEPFEAMPLVYERAFGGWDRSSPDPAQHEFEPRNPVGVGFVAKRNGAVQEGSPLPNLENPRDLVTGPTDRPTPIGFGFIGPHWQPRARYAGTYDAGWQRDRMPLLPDDFDRRYYNAAYPSLALQGFLRGGEPVEVLNVSEEGPLRFWLPTFQPFGSVRMKDGGIHRFGMALDTIILNTDEDRLFLIWRGSLPIDKRVHDVLWAKAQLAEGGAVRL